MGERHPKSGDGGTVRGRQDGPNDPTGRGAYDAGTGLWEWYDRGEDEETGDPVTWEQILDQWPVIVADFADVYGIRLHREQPPWCEFRDLIQGLLAGESRLWRALKPPEEDTKTHGG